MTQRISTYYPFILKKILKQCFLTFFVILLFANNSFGQTFDPNAKYKALFLYSFTKYIEWPASYKNGDFVIGVLGNTSALPQLKAMAAKHKAGSQNIVIKQINSIKEIGKFHMLYITEEKSGELGAALNRCKSYSTLVITEKNGLASKGSAINFVVKNNSQKFEINTSNATNKNLKVSTSLTNLGIKVN